MKTVLAIHLKNLPLTAHYDFFLRVDGFYNSASQDVLNVIGVELPAFRTALAKEDLLGQWTKKSLLTAKIAEADHIVDSYLVGLNTAVESALHLPDANVVDAAKRLRFQLKNYGNIPRESYDKEEGSLRMLLDNLTGASAADVATVGVEAWVTRLQSAVNNFSDLLLQRETEQLQKPDYTFKQIRKEIEIPYHKIAHLLDAGSALGTGAGFDVLIDKLNADIERVNAEFNPVAKDLGEGEHTDVESIADQVYTGEPIAVFPTAWYREAGKKPVKLVFAKDYSLTYRNNTHVGSAEVILHGKGKYKGHKSVSFRIVPA